MDTVLRAAARLHAVFNAKPFEGFRGNPSMFNVHLVNGMSVPDKYDRGEKAGAKRAW
jgi:hypothetical protein